MSTLDWLQKQPCNCPACVHKRLRQSILKTLLPDAERVEAVKKSLKVALNLLNEITGDSPCECPTCMPGSPGDESIKCKFDAQVFHENEKSE